MIRCGPFYVGNCDGQERQSARTIGVAMAGNSTNQKRQTSMLTGACFGAFVGLALGILVMATFRSGGGLSAESTLGNGALIGCALGARFPGVAGFAIGLFQSIFP